MFAIMDRVYLNGVTIHSRVDSLLEIHAEYKRSNLFSLAVSDVE